MKLGISFGTLWFKLPEGSLLYKLVSIEETGLFKLLSGWFIIEFWLDTPDNCEGPEIKGFGLGWLFPNEPIGLFKLPDGRLVDKIEELLKLLLFIILIEFGTCPNKFWLFNTEGEGMYWLFGLGWLKGNGWL